MKRLNYEHYDVITICYSDLDESILNNIELQRALLIKLSGKQNGDLGEFVSVFLNRCKPGKKVYFTTKFEFEGVKYLVHSTIQHLNDNKATWSLDDINIMDIDLEINYGLFTLGKMKAKDIYPKNLN